MFKEKGVNVSSEEELAKISSEVLAIPINSNEFFSITLADLIAISLVGTERSIPKNVLEAVLLLETNEDNKVMLKNIVESWNGLQPKYKGVFREIKVMLIGDGIANIGTHNGMEANLKRRLLAWDVQLYGPELLEMIRG